MVKKKKQLDLLGENLTPDEEIEDIVSFTDYIEPTGDIIKLFSLRDSAPNKNELESNSKDSTTLLVDTPISDNRIGKPATNGITPPVNGESFNIKRGYCMRRSTVVMLNELKACHPNISVYMNSIVDAAISHYYNYITKEDGSQI